MEEVKLTLPDSWDEITISQFQEFHLINQIEDMKPYKKIISLISILTDMDEDFFYKLPMDSIHQINETIDFMSSEPKDVFKNIITVNGVEYGFQKNLHQLSLGEWIDLEHYITKDVIENLHYITAILYRKIISKGDEYFDYEILDYEKVKLDDVANLFKNNISIQDVWGIVGFFFLIVQEFLGTIVSSSRNQKEMIMNLMNRITNQKLKKIMIEKVEENLSKNGDGNFSYTLFQEMILPNMI